MRIAPILAAHAHHWTTTSRHRTSQGVVAYGRCACGRWRVNRDTTAQVEQTLAVTSAGMTCGAISL